MIKTKFVIVSEKMPSQDRIGFCRIEIESILQMYKIESIYSEQKTTFGDENCKNLKNKKNTR